MWQNEHWLDIWRSRKTQCWMHQEVAKQQGEKVWSEQFTHFQLRQQQGYQFLAAWPGNTKWWSFLLTIEMTKWTDRYFCCFFHLQRMFSPCLIFSKPLAFLINSISAAEVIFSFKTKQSIARKSIMLLSAQLQVLSKNKCYICHKR